MTEGAPALSREDGQPDALLASSAFVAVLDRGRPGAPWRGRDAR